MRVLICGVIGAVVAAAAWLGLEHYLQRDVGWLAVAVGLVTGLSVHKGAGSALGGGYARGGLAALLALAAIVGGRQVYAKVMEAVNESAKAVVTAPVEGTKTADDSGDEDTSSSGVTDPEVEDLREGPSRMGGVAGQKMPMKKRFSEMEMVWMVGAALLAYITGKGPDPVPVSEEKADEKTDEPPPAQGDSEQ